MVPTSIGYGDVGVMYGDDGWSSSNSATRGCYYGVHPVWFKWNNNGTGNVTTEGCYYFNDAESAGVWLKWAGRADEYIIEGNATCGRVTVRREVPVTQELPATETAEEKLAYEAAVAERRRLFDERVAKANEEMKQRDAERRAEEERTRVAREAAAAKAEALLLSYLDEQQKKEYEADKAFHVISQEGKRYRVERKRSGNVLELEEKEGQVMAVARYCLHSVAYVPLGDDMLVALIMLRSSEQDYKRIANRTQFSPYPIPRLRAEGSSLGGRPEPLPVQAQAA